MYIYSKTISNQSHEVTKAKLTFVILVYTQDDEDIFRIRTVYWRLGRGGGGEGRVTNILLSLPSISPQLSSAADTRHYPNGLGTCSLMKWSRFICFAQFYRRIGPDYYGGNGGHWDTVLDGFQCSLTVSGHHCDQPSMFWCWWSD